MEATTPHASLGGSDDLILLPIEILGISITLALARHGHKEELISSAKTFPSHQTSRQQTNYQSQLYNIHLKNTISI